LGRLPENPLRANDELVYRRNPSIVFSGQKEYRRVVRAELESSLISERVKAGMAAARAHGKRPGRPATPAPLVSRIEALAGTTGMSTRQIQEALVSQVSHAVVGCIVKHVREQSHTASL